MYKENYYMTNIILIILDINALINLPYDKLIELITFLMFSRQPRADTNFVSTVIIISVGDNTSYENTGQLRGIMIKSDFYSSYITI